MRNNLSNLFRACCLFIPLLLCCLISLAQTGTIRGNVKDANGLPMAGASVILEGTKKGTLTNSSGDYLIQVSPGTYMLVVSYVGTQTQRKQIIVVPNEDTRSDFDLINSGELSQVIVGSRSSTARTRIQTPVPVDVIQISQVVNDIGQVELSQILNFIAPSFQSARQTIADGTDHVDPAQLRGLGTDQVLVLINGKRRHQSALVNVNGTVNRGSVGTDMSAIPATAIERIEILRDGASAQYGSDAIAGVINIVLKKRTGLLEAGVSYGQYITSYDKNYAIYKLANKTDDPSVKVRDGENVQASLGYGFAIGKGYLNLTGEYIDRQPTNRAGTYTGRIYPLVNGANRDDSIMQARGLDRNYFDLHIGNSEMKGGNVFYNFGYPVSDKTEIYVFGGYGKKKGTAAGFYRYPDGATSIVSGATIYRNNVLAMYPNGFLPQINSDLIDFSVAAGLRTKIDQWDFDISNTFGINKFDFTIDQSVNYTQFFLPGNKQTVFDAGGLKFWQNTMNADFSRKFNVLEGMNLAVGVESRVDVFGIRSGEPASYLNYDTASKAASGAQVFAGFKPSGKDKSRNANAAYADVELDITKKFLLTGALRFENYTDFGSTLNYKFSTRYRISDNFNIRASASSGFRAPSMQQRFYEKTSTLFVSTPSGLVATESGTFTNDSKAAQILGIPQLKEETSNNYSVGIAARPFRGFEITIDAYQVNIKNRIVLTNNFTGGNNQALKDQLAAAGASTANFFSNAIDTRARGLETVLSYNINFAGKHSLRAILAAIFIDNEVKKGADGKPIIHASPILVSSGQLGNYFNREDQSRIEVANPKNKVSLTLNYKVSKFGAMVRFVNFGKVIYLDPTMDPANPGAFPMNAFNNNARETLDQEFASKLVTDVSLSYQVTKELGLTIGANNLLDVYQDRHTHSGNMSFGRFIFSRRVQQQGFNGAYYFARLKFELPVKK
ncbi:MAG TPA: TonB-dependent receptor [Chitinophagaceae bacterium]